MKKFFYTLSVLVCLLVVSENAWATTGAGHYTHLRTYSSETAKGLVYANTSNTATVTNSSYAAISISESLQGQGQYKNNKYTGGVALDFYGWAQPARGYRFVRWDGFNYYSVDPSNATSDAGQEKAATPKANTGTADRIVVTSWGGGNGYETWGTAQAVWEPATSYTVTYKEPVGGSYSVSYSYLKVENNAFKTATETLSLSPGSGDKKPYGLTDTEHENGYSYAADVIKLTVPTADRTNFLGWYKGDTYLGNTTEDFVYSISSNPENANISAHFKWIEVSTPEETLISTKLGNADVAASVEFEMTSVTGSWAASDFTVTLEDATGTGTFGNVTKSYVDNTLTVNFTYNANGVYGSMSTVNIQVTPSNGAGATAAVKASAEEDVSFETKVLIEGAVDKTGTLAEMLEYANGLTADDITLQLAQNVTVTSTLQFKKTMTLDLNSKTLSSTTLSNLILVKGNSASDIVKLTINDGSELKAGAISLVKSENGIIQAIKIDDANQMILNVGNVLVENTATYASNSNAKAYGAGVVGTATLKMFGGSISATSDHNAYGVYAGAGYATLFAGSISASAKAEAYGIYSAGTTNISSGVSVAATSTTGNAAAALHVNGGKTVLDNVALTATAAASYAYGVNVQAGQLSMNGGSATVAAATSYVYGVNVQSGASATIQQNANIAAEATGASGTRVYGVNNLGTLKLVNSAITATAHTNYATAVNSETSAVSTTIEDGTYSAVSSTGYAYGLHHQYGELEVDGGLFTATSEGDNVYGARAAVDGAISNATISAETTGSGKTVYGFAGGVENKNISLTNCTIKAKSATSLAYGIYSRANVTATGCVLEAKALSGATACGFYAENGTNVLGNTNATVESYTTGAYGVNFVAGLLTVNGGAYNITAKQESATGAADSDAYGVKVADGKTANLMNAIFNINAAKLSFSRKAYGIYTGTGTINSTGCTYTVSAASQVYGIYGATSSSLSLQNNIISATTTGSITANGIYSNGAFSVNGDKITSQTQTYDSYALCLGSSAHGLVQSGKFKALGVSSAADQFVAPINNKASASNVHVQGGFFNSIVQLRYYVPTGYDIYGVDPDVTEYADGYYYTVNDHMPYENVCYITEKNVGFPTLEEAFDYARNHSGSSYNIVMIQPYTLPAGNYSLPTNAKLVVPDKVSRTSAQGAIPDRRGNVTELILENRLLTFASGVNLDVYGKIEVSAQQYGHYSTTAYVLGPYGRIHTEAGSTITLNSGSAIYAWGYITGQGEIRVKNGATVFEDFQVHDMKAPSTLSSSYVTSSNKSTYKVFPINQYYIQNVEAPTKYYYGSKLTGSMCTTNGASPSTINVNEIKLVGTNGCLFQVTADDEASWVQKRYDPVADRIIWETNSSAELGSMMIDISGASIDSKDYYLPLTNNMTIHALTGLFTITQGTVMLPGTEIIIDKPATLRIKEKDPYNKDMGLYLYDKSQWSTNASPILYSPSWNNGVCPRDKAYSSMKDAAIYVKGKIQIDGYIYTTAGGAAIYSDNTNAGTIEFNKDAAADATLYKKSDGSSSVPVTSAKLRNGGETGPDANMTITKGVAAANDTYAYMDIDNDGVYMWTNLATLDECIVQDKNTSVYYAKPQGYVAITDASEDANHLFHSVEGERLFINMPTDAGCQWWDVIAQGDGVYYCGTNDTYYEWGQLDPALPDEGWKEVKRTVTFYFTDPKSDDEDKKKVLTVNYGAKPDVSIVSNPSKAEDAAATYQFRGWKYSETGVEHAYTATDYEAVYDNGTYYLPVFDTITKKYTITFKKAKNNTDVPVECFYGQSPEYAASWASSAQYDYEFTGWKAADNTVYPVGEALPIVTGATYYTAQWTNHTRSYNITWKNGDEILEVDENQPYGTATAYNGASLPTKATDNEYVYAFSKWKSSLNGNSYNNGSTPTVAGETTYEAQYNTTPRYAITFNNYDGTQLARTIYTEGEHPAYDGVPARKRDADGYFVFIGWKDGNGTDYAANATLPEVTGKETYTAQYNYTNDLFTITLNNVDGNGASWSGKFGVGSTPFYDPNEDDVPDTPTKAGNVQYSYPFTGWEPALVPVSGVATYTAQFGEEINSYTITFANIDGHGAEEIVKVEYGSTPVCTNLTSAYYVGQQMYLFRAWKRSSDQLEYTTLPEVVGDETYTAQYDPVENLEVDDEKTINSDASVGITIVRQTGKLTLASGKTLTTSDLILEASETASGQIMETGTITATNVYYDLELNTDARHWHAFGVPWAVDINTNELQEVDGGNVVRTLRISHDYEIVYFDGEERAANGPSSNCWKYLRHYEDTEHGQPVDELIPGHGYMIAFASHVNTVRFVKKSVAPIIFDGSVGVTAHQICGISNPMAYHATLSNIGATFGQVHDGGEIGHDDYTEVDIDDKRFVVGKTVYIEPQASGTVAVNKADGGVSPIAAAPARHGMAADKQYLSLSDYYTIALTPEDGSRAAKVYVLPEEDKEDKYVAGHDLAKMGMSDRKAQIWVERYEAQLGLNTTAPIKEVATFPINLYAPKAGEYIISLASQPNDEYTVYLMRDGAIIWNLSRSGYAITLDAGTDKTYSLRLTHKSPGVMIDIEEELVDAQGETSKVIINGKVFIIRGNQVYSIDGQIVKFGNNND